MTSLRSLAIITAVDRKGFFAYKRNDATKRVALVRYSKK